MDFTRKRMERQQRQAEDDDDGDDDKGAKDPALAAAEVRGYLERAAVVQWAQCSGWGARARGHSWRTRGSSTLTSLGGRAPAAGASSQRRTFLRTLGPRDTTTPAPAPNHRPHPLLTLARLPEGPPGR